MKLEETIFKSEYYTDYSQLKSSVRDIIEKSEISAIRTFLFDEYGLEKMYVCGSCLLRESVASDVYLFVELNKSQFEDFIEKRQDVINELIVFCKIGDVVYKVSLNSIQECDVHHKLLINGKRLY